MEDKSQKSAQDELNATLAEIERKIKSFKTLELPQVDWQLYALLRRLGLTKYEILVYVALVLGGQQTISQLTGKESITGIPQPRAYDVLGSLIKYGLVEEGRSEPTKEFRPIPPEDGLENLLNFFINAKTQAVQRLNSLKQTYESSYGGIWEIRNKYNLIKAAQRIASYAECEILLVSDFEILSKLIPTFKTLHQDQCIISVIIQSGDIRRPDDILDWVKFLKIKKRGTFSMPYLIVDRKYALQWGLNKAIGQIIENIEVIRTLIDHFFFSNWKIGKVFSDEHKEIKRNYPLSCVNVQSAIEEIEFIRKQGKNAKVEIFGVNTHTRNQEMLKGEVIQTESNWETGKFSITIKSEGKHVTLGGMLATLEDISANKIIIQPK